jgi:hypothetical protein
MPLLTSAGRSAHSAAAPCSSSPNSRCLTARFRNWLGESNPSCCSSVRTILGCAMSGTRSLAGMPHALYRLRRPRR